MRKKSSVSLPRCRWGMEEGGCVSCKECSYRRLNTLEKIYEALENKSPKIDLPEDIRSKAKKSLDKMLEMS